MIKSKEDYQFYLKADRIALGIDESENSWSLKKLVTPHPRWSFQKNLRRLEYYKNCRKDPIGRAIYYIYKYRFLKQSIRLGFSIPENVFGPGLAIAHYGTIIINDNARIGKNCRIHAMVNIGASGGSDRAPQIGDNVYIGPGAIIYGDIRIGSNTAISANSTVNKSFEQDGILLAGSPARVIKEYDISNVIKRFGA